MPERELALVTFGETMALLTNPDVVPLRHATTLRVGIAGAESNTAIGFVRLGGRAAWMGRVGDDEFGAMVLARLRGEGLDIDAATVDDLAPTGLMIKGSRAAGAVEVAYYRRASAASRLSPELVDHDRIRQAGVLHVTGITPALSDTARETVFVAVETARAAGTTVSFDPNYRSALWPADEAAACFRDLAGRADVVLAGVDEAELMYGEAEPAALARAIAGSGASQAVVKRGRDGAVALIDGAEVAASAAPRTVIDPVGAGDAFAAGYLSGLVAGATPGERLDLACRMAAVAVTTQGDWEGLPHAGEELLTDVVDDVRR